MLKFITGVGVVFIIAALSFGLKVYAFMESGDRFTAQDGVSLEHMVEDNFTTLELHDRDMRYITERLDRIEMKLDLILQEK